MKAFHKAFAMTFVALILAGCSKDDSSNPFDGVVIELETNEKCEVDLRPDGAVVSSTGLILSRILCIQYVAPDLILADEATNISMDVKYGDGETCLVPAKIETKGIGLALKVNGTPEEFALMLRKAETVAIIAENGGHTIESDQYPVEHQTDDEILVTRNLAGDFVITATAIDKALDGELVTALVARLPGIRSSVSNPDSEVIVVAVGTPENVMVDPVTAEHVRSLTTACYGRIAIPYDDIQEGHTNVFKVKAKDDAILVVAVSEVARWR